MRRCNNLDLVLLDKRLEGLFNVESCGTDARGENGSCWFSLGPDRMTSFGWVRRLRSSSSDLLFKRKIENVHGSGLNMDIEGRQVPTVEYGSMLAGHSSFQLQSCSVKGLTIDEVWTSNESGRMRVSSLQVEPGKEPVSITPLMTRDEGEKWGRLKRASRVMEGNDKCVGGYASVCGMQKMFWWES